MQGISPRWWFAATRRWLTGQRGNAEPRLIHRDRKLATVWLPGRSDRLVLVFTSIQAKSLHPDRLEFRGVASDQGRNHVLFICDRRRRWYSHPGVRDRIAALVRDFAARQGIGTIWSVGNSMGGYGAILFCDRLPIDSVVAYVPQILMTDEVIDDPIWIKNRRHIQDGVERDLTPIIAASGGSIAIVYGDQDADDRIHIGHLRRMLPQAKRLKIVVAPGQAHGVAGWLKAQGQLARLTAALWLGDRDVIEDCSKTLERPLNLSMA